jgi:uncharacterized integral membrane protein
VNIIAFILFLIAAVIFLVADREVGLRYRAWVSVPLGLCLLTVGFIVQFCSATHTVHF